MIIHEVSRFCYGDGVVDHTYWLKRADALRECKKRNLQLHIEHEETREWSRDRLRYASDPGPLGHGHNRDQVFRVTEIEVN